MKNQHFAKSSNLFAKALELALDNKPTESSLMLALGKEIRALEVSLSKLALRSKPEMTLAIASIA